MYNLTALCIILLHCVQSYPETSHVHKITYGPLIDTALYVMGLMGANPLLQTALASLELFQGPKKF